MNDDSRIRVFIVDDHPMIRVGLVAMIDGEHDMVCVGQAGEGNDAVRLIAQATPDVVLMDLVIPNLDGIAVTALLHPRLPSTRFVILTSLVDAGEIDRAIAAGANGYVLKTASAHELVGVIRAAHAGRRMLSPEVSDAMIAQRQNPLPGGDLTPRERELLTLMTQGFNNQDIATELSIAMPTVKFHITNILSKLQANNRTEAVLTALKRKLVRAP